MNKEPQNHRTKESVHEGLTHTKIVKLFKLIVTKETVFLVTKHRRRGDMFDHLQDHSRVTETEARGTFQQLVSAVQDCYQRGIVHKDLKPQNVLFGAQMNIKIADFGLSTQFSGSKLSTFCGSPLCCPRTLSGPKI